MTRTCTVCNSVKELEQFPRDANAKFGHRSQCIECRKAYHRANYKIYYAKNRKEKIAKVMAREKRLRDAGEYKKAPFRSSEEFLERERIRSKFRRLDPSVKRYHANYVRIYLARKFNAPGTASRKTLQAKWDYYGGICWLCPSEATEMDHVKPLSKGGSNWPANLKPICRPCNARKSNKWPFSKPTSKE